MIRMITPGPRLLPAKLACVKILPGVNPLMGLECGLLNEAPVASHAAVGFLTVQVHVPDMSLEFVGTCVGYGALREVWTVELFVWGCCFRRERRLRRGRLSRHIRGRLTNA